MLQAAEDKNTLTNLEMTEMLYSESQVDKMQCHHKKLWMAQKKYKSDV